MPRYHSPLAQVLIISGVCFLGPGMFNALNGLGGAGQLAPQTAGDANSVVYFTLFIFSILGGGIVNVFGVRYTTAIGCIAYALYTGSFVYYNHLESGTLTVASGVAVGMGGGILWSAQGVIMVSYPSENEKGKFICIFWIIFNLGGLIGGILPFAINYNNTGSLTDSVYILFVVLECIGAATALFLVPPTTVVRDDGSRATIFKSSSIRQECREVLRLFKNRWMLLLLPMSFSSNFFYGYQFSHYNGALFTLRTRGFNNMLYWGSQIFSVFLLYLLLDFSRWTRRKRGICAMIIILITFNAVWAGTLVIQLRYTKGGSDTDYPGGLVDFLDIPRAAGPAIVYFFMGVADSWYQSMAYWIIGTLTSDSYKTARYIGFYKGIQSLGAAVSWYIAARDVPYLNQLIGNWVLFLVALPTMFYTVVHIKERDTFNKLLVRI
ncbi:MFS general substrate transporter [Coemansia reversa NRRL 1564]|uniref:MFS general substrate transporter n=1 Tax=Coemansia reversa (strain ATCC 12441 / NRRL 1564) TaxID=763665 RepID=A0A2G5BG80_COERN|nr:MFS general substrate transporter [Coemansia reversa NRRL 1564]|eukprot:PIA18003.1 MFS general substrate transporter [Coemansia reversa NRRL 1564]